MNIVHYRNGYNAQKEGKDRVSPHRPNTKATADFLAGFDAAASGAPAPKAPRHRRTKAEMQAARAEAVTLVSDTDTDTSADATEIAA